VLVKSTVEWFSVIFISSIENSIVLFKVTKIRLCVSSKLGLQGYIFFECDVGRML